MFEISIFCLILLAISYWAVLWVMGRREDVLHGEFVDAGAQADEPVRPVFPDRAALPERAARPVFPKKPVIAEKPAQPAIAEPAAPAVPEQPAFRQERLESLLNSIKQDLNQLVQK
jgi:hypothetical protein